MSSNKYFNPPVLVEKDARSYAYAFSMRLANFLWKLGLEKAGKPHVTVLSANNFAYRMTNKLAQSDTKTSYGRTRKRF